MNNLVIDIGNSNIVIGYITENSKEVYRFNSDVDKTSDEYRSVFENTINHLQVDNILISSVVPKLTNTIKIYCEKTFEIKVDIVEPGYKTGIKIKTVNPKEVGSDLICGVVGAMQYSKSGIIIDLGTTSKVLYYKDSELISAIIAPGIKISAASITNNAAQLSDFPLKKPDRVLGRNTIEALQSGIVYGHIAMINGLIDLIEVELGETLPIYLTGGLSHIIDNNVNFKYQYKPDLILEALNTMIIKNMEKDNAIKKS